MSNPTIKTPTVRLFTHTMLPLESVYAIWYQSKETGPAIDPWKVREVASESEVRDLFKRVIQQRIPVGESVSFTFLLENISVSWREQAVRHRIGVSPSPERLGADIGMLDVREIPDRSSSSFWSQSMRIQDMSNFATEGAYRVPETILNHPRSASLLDAYRTAMERAEVTYETLVRNGIPMEDARELIPLGAQHRMTWTLNISALQHILGERGCWILQLGLWGPIIMGMVRELAEKVDPVFNELVTPPCLIGTPDPSEGAIDANHGYKFHSPPPEWIGCRFHEENARRYDGRDKLPPCTLHYTHHATAEQKVGCEHPDVVQAMGERAQKYMHFWGRDPWNGRKVRLPMVKE